MNKLVVLFITAIIALCLTGCWGTATENANTANANVTSNANATEREITNTDLEEINNPPSNGGNVNQQTMMDIQSNKVGKHVKSGEPGEDSPEMKKAGETGQYKIAPENSVISNEMNKDGNPAQTRKFNKDPRIDRVEIIALGEKERKRLVYLKNGKVLELPKGTVENPMTASINEILEAVGVESKIPEQPNSEKKDGKKQ